jgi:hypothetical protein
VYRPRAAPVAYTQLGELYSRSGTPRAFRHAVQREHISELVDVLVEIMTRERSSTDKREVRVELALPDGVDRRDVARELAKRAASRRCSARRRVRA